MQQRQKVALYTSVETGSDSDSLDSNQIPVLTGFGIDSNLIFKDPPKILLKIFHV